MIDLKKYLDEKFIKFLLVGVVNTIVGAGTMFLLYNLCNWSYWWASAANYVVGGICSYFLNKFFTFKDNSKSIKQIVLFILNLFICYIIAYWLSKEIIFAILNGSVSVKLIENIAMLVGMCTYTLLNYFGQRLFIFKSNKD